MNKPEDTNRVEDGTATQQKRRKPYHKPAVRHERVFETSAMTCGKVQITDSQCHQMRKYS